MQSSLGPLAGDGFKSASIWRGRSHRLRSMVSRSTSRDACSSCKSLRCRRHAPSGLPPRFECRPLLGGSREATWTVKSAASKSCSTMPPLWRGTIGQGLAAGRVMPPRSRQASSRTCILGKAEELGLRGCRRHRRRIASVPGLGCSSAIFDPNSLPAVVQRARASALARSRRRPTSRLWFARSPAPQSLQQSLLAAHALILRVLDVPDLQAQPDDRFTAVRSAARLSAACNRPLEGHPRRNRNVGLDFPQYLQLIRASLAAHAAVRCACFPRLHGT